MHEKNLKKLKRAEAGLQAENQEDEDQINIYNYPILQFPGSSIC